MAAQVRLAFPTTVLADQVGRGVLPVAGNTDLAGAVSRFLAAAASQAQFEIGVEPVEGFLARTAYAAPSAEVIAGVKRLQRVYQLTTDDTIMTVLLRPQWTPHMPSPVRRGRVPARIRQTSSAARATRRPFTPGRARLQLGDESRGRLPGRAARAGARRPHHVQHGFPRRQSPQTLPGHGRLPDAGSLFGSLDYCGCSDCGSILSPAAYLVDLLHYIDQPSPRRRHQTRRMCCCSAGRTWHICR